MLFRLQILFRNQRLLRPRQSQQALRLIRLQSPFQPLGLVEPLGLFQPLHFAQSQELMQPLAAAHESVNVPLPRMGTRWARKFFIKLYGRQPQPKRLARVPS